ncbi:MAG: hypothetical protein KAT15_25255, partial [Bacteroidales bacterium]|nr:hypothetical protein [Bacteroidales bacterium]
MFRSILYVLITWFCSSATGQVHHSCPLHPFGEKEFINPLYGKWLSGYDVKYYDIDLSVSNKNTEISGGAAIAVEALRDLDTIVFELQDALTITGVFVNDAISDTTFTVQVDFEHKDDAVFIRLDRTRNAGEEFTILLLYNGEAGQSRGFFAGITSAKDPDYGFDVTYTLSEPHNAKDWFPVKQVLDDKIDSVRMRLRCDKQLMAASNGVLLNIEEEDANSHSFIWRTNYPIAYYLISFAVADYRDYSYNAALSEAGDSVLVQNYIYDSDTTFDDWKDGILETGPMITTFSKLFMDYPFADEKYGHAMAPMGGGMEHQTMTTIHHFGFSLVAHELAHQWFGDYITCGNWQDIWIN